MTIDTQSQAINSVLAVSQQVSVPKDQVVKKEKDVEHSTQLKTEVEKEVKQQPIEIPENTTKTENTTEVPELSRENIQEAVNKLQDYVDKYERDLRFSIDDDTGRTVVSLLDNDNKVVKQYPSEELLSLISNLEQNKGLFIGEA